MMGKLSFPRLFEAENAFAGRSSFEGEDTDRWLSIAALSIAVFYFAFKLVTEMDMSLDERLGPGLSDEEKHIAIIRMYKALM